jgi:hypothetical protein
MIFSMTVHTFTLAHVVLSLVGIGSGLIVVFGMMAGKRLNGLTALFLLTTIATSATGFGFPVEDCAGDHHGDFHCGRHQGGKGVPESLGSPTSP